jgi:hypothetical protein
MAVPDEYMFFEPENFIWPFTVQYNTKFQEQAPVVFENVESTRLALPAKNVKKFFVAFCLFMNGQIRPILLASISP